MMDLTVIPAKKQLRKKRYSVKMLNGTLAVLKNDRPYSIAGDCHSLAAGGQQLYPNELSKDLTMDWRSLGHDSQLDKEVVCRDTDELDREHGARRKYRSDSGFSELSEKAVDDEHGPEVDFNTPPLQAYASHRTPTGLSTQGEDEEELSEPSSKDAQHGACGAVAEFMPGLHFNDGDCADCGLEGVCCTLDVLHENLRAVCEDGADRPAAELLAEMNSNVPCIVGSFKAGVSPDGFCKSGPKISFPAKRKVLHERLYETFQLIKTSLKQWRTYVPALAAANARTQ